MEDRNVIQKPPVSPPLPGAGFMPGVSEEREVSRYITHSEPELKLTDELRQIGLETSAPVIPEQHQTAEIRISEPNPALSPSVTVNAIQIAQEPKAVDATHAESWIATLIERVKTKIPLLANL